MPAAAKPKPKLTPEERAELKLVAFMRDVFDLAKKHDVMFAAALFPLGAPAKTTTCVVNVRDSAPLIEAVLEESIQLLRKHLKDNWKELRFKKRKK